MDLIKFCFIDNLKGEVSSSFVRTLSTERVQCIPSLSTGELPWRFWKIRSVGGRDVKI